MSDPTGVTDIKVKEQRKRESLFQQLIAIDEFGGIMILLIMVFFMFVFVGPSFFSSYNIFSTLRQFCFVGIAALGEMLVILTGGIDLSVGGIAGMSGIVSAWIMANTGIDPYLTLVVGLLVGLSTGYLNGLLITKVGINPFIVTLGTMQIYLGVNMIITEGWPITNISPDILWLGQGRIVGIFPVAAIILFIIILFFEIVLRVTTLGRKLYAIGNNETASFLCGVKVQKIKVTAYTLSGLLASLAGVITLARLSSGQPTMGTGWELQAIAAVIIGGGSLAGGSGSAIGTLIGAAIIGMINQAIVLLNVSSFWQRVVLGTVIILAVLFDYARKGWRK